VLRRPMISCSLLCLTRPCRLARYAHLLTRLSICIAAAAARKLMEAICDKPVLRCPAGEAINPRNLSFCERVMGVGKNYNKQLDREDL